MSRRYAGYTSANVLCPVPRYAGLESIPCDAGVRRGEHGDRFLPAGRCEGSGYRLEHQALLHPEGFPVGANQYGSGPITITIQSFAVDASTNLQANCDRVKNQLAATHPGLTFTCGSPGSYYSSIQPAQGMSIEEAQAVVMVMPWSNEFTDPGYFRRNVNRWGNPSIKQGCHLAALSNYLVEIILR